MSFGLQVVGVNATLDLLKETRSFWSDTDDAAYVVAPLVSYAVEQEKGTSSFRARPFMRPAARRVDENKEAMLDRYGSAAPRAGPVETLAIAVQNEAKKIADRKDIRDTGQLINSITFEEV